MNTQAIGKIQKPIKPKPVSKKSNILRYSIITLLIVIIVTAGITAGLIISTIRSTPPLTDDMLALKNFNSFVFDDKGVKVDELSMNENRIWADYDQIPQDMKDALVAIEDRRFFQHEGVDVIGLVRAVFNKIIHPSQPMTGASTITMQVIKNITKEDQRTLQRKIQEQWRAIELEKKWEKWQILQTYMNVIVTGPNIYGVQTAANRYFNKDVSQLTLAECTAIAGITNNPSLYDVYTAQGLANDKARQKDILDIMLELKNITKEEYDAALAEKLVFYNADASGPASVTDTQSYFVDQVVLDVKKELMTQGMTETDAIDRIYNGGLRIYTTMDSSVQEIMDRVFTDPALWPASPIGNENRQGAMVILDNTNAQVKAMYGGYGPKTGNTLNRATQIERQPGSAIKPIAVYGPALNEKLITPATLIDDAPVYMNGPDAGLYPQNFSQTFRGPTTIREAVRDSLNVVAAKVYADIIGPDLPLQYLAKVGIVRDQRNVALAIGGMDQGISPLQAAAAYIPFVNRGIYTAPSIYTKVEDQFGRTIIEMRQPESVVVYSQQAAYLMNSIMQDVTTFGTAADVGELTGLNGEQIRTAGKSGTTEDGRDHWFVGMTPYYTAADWYGYDNNEPVPYGAEWVQSTRLWKAVMAEVSGSMAGKDFEIPSGLVHMEVCISNGKIVSTASLKNPTNAWMEYFIKGTEPTDAKAATTKNQATPAPTKKKK
jgi:penicillin-binding protein 1A